MSPIRYTRSEDGKLSAWVFAEADRVLLRHCGELLVTELGAEAVERFDGGDQIFWDFIAGGLSLTLHMDQKQGIAVVVSNPTERTEALVKNIAEALVRRIQR